MCTMHRTDACGPLQQKCQQIDYPFALNGRDAIGYYVHTGAQPRANETRFWPFCINMTFVTIEKQTN